MFLAIRLDVNGGIWFYVKILDARVLLFVFPVVHVLI